MKLSPLLWFTAPFLPHDSTMISLDKDEAVFKVKQITKSSSTSMTKSKKALKI